MAAPVPRPSGPPLLLLVLSLTDGKRIAGEMAASFVESGMTLGLGTGSTTEHFVRRLGERVRGEGLRVRGVPTSKATEVLAREVGIPLASLEDVEEIDLTVDGADEIDGAFRMIKGGGGALLREKVIASLSRFEVIVVGPGKVVDRLGTTFALPIEVVHFAVSVVERRLRPLGAVSRRMRGAEPFVTDNGNAILDVRFPSGIEDPADLDSALRRIPGVVETGLFLGLAHRLVEGRADGTVHVRDCPRCGG
ncbi:MAG: ribose-5-phosphate isomerase RpiA [Planctomycetes bacterium]|nr:ribose-5-phosphate isomerase RpiA [Planctomycetota bacterium]